MAASTSSLASKVGSGLGFQRSELRGLPPPSVQISIQRHSRPSRRLGKNSFWFLCFGLLFDLYLKLSVFFCFSLHEAKTKKLAILWLSYDLFASFYLCWIWLRKIGFFVLFKWYLVNLIYLLELKTWILGILWCFYDREQRSKLLVMCLEISSGLQLMENLMEVVLVVLSVDALLDFPYLKLICKWSSTEGLVLPLWNMDFSFSVLILLSHVCECSSSGGPGKAG